MLIARTLPELHDYLSARKGLRRGLVPTMGNLHSGHLALIRQAQAHSDLSIATIFVNRLQFLPHEDFDAYPRTFEQDVEALSRIGCDVLFAPTEAQLYPQPQTCKVLPNPQLAQQLEGAFRPGFFTGVCTVVMKLFQITQPDVAVFGKKDYQQLQVIENMVAELNLPIRILRGETLRDTDGLALSSRNRYLSAPERAQAVQLSQALQTLASAVQTPNLSAAHLEALQADSRQALQNKGWQVDYIAIRRQAGLAPIDPVQREPWVALGAARLGSTRLIDNFEF